MKKFKLLGLIIFSLIFDYHLHAGSYSTSGSLAAPCINVSVPNGSTGVQFQLTMTGGDWDLYVNLPGNGCPTTGSFYCRSWNGGTSTEDCGSYTAPNSCGSGNSTYQVLVDPYNLSGTWTLTVTWVDCGGPPANDNCSGATILPLDECNSTPFVLPKEATNSGLPNPSCLQPNGSGCGSGAVSEDIWYRFTANSSTTVVEAINTNQHMAVQVYSGTCGSLTPVPGGCSDICGSPATETMTISTNQGQTYYIRLMRTDGTNTDDMSGSIRVYPNSSHPNQGVFGTVTVTNSRGSAPNLTLNGTPNSCTDVGTLRTGRIRVRNLGGSTMDGYISSESCFVNTHGSSSAWKNKWATVTIPAGSSINGLYFYSTIEGVCPQPSSSTNLRTGYINVFTGTSSCTPISACGGTWDNIITSYNLGTPYIETLGTLRVDVVAGQTYYIEIWTTSLATDPNFNFDVHVVPVGNPPTNENCNNAIAFAGSGVGCNLGADPACTPYTIPCMNTVENSVFYTFESPGVPFQIEVESVVCEGGEQDLQAGIFEMNAGTCLGNLSGANLVASGCFTGTRIFNINSPLPAGSDYLIWFDGNAGAACTWGFSILPVEWKYFEVEELGDDVGLFWQTVTETNSYYFDIERSANNKNWNSIGRLNGAGTTSSSSNYRFIDEQPNFGINYYRIKQVDFDGEYSYSDVKAIDFKRKKDHLIVPNPNDGNFLLTAIKKNSLIEIRSLSGQLVYSLISENANEIIELQNIESGMYLLSLDGQYLEKIIIR